MSVNIEAALIMYKLYKLQHASQEIARPFWWYWSISVFVEENCLALLENIG